MRDGQRLPKLSTPHRLLHQLCEEGVRVIVKAFDVRACQNQKRVGQASEIEFRSSAIVDAMKVADRKRGLGTFALIQNAGVPRKTSATRLALLPSAVKCATGSAEAKSSTRRVTESFITSLKL